MNTHSNIKAKGIYSAPEILTVKLDNEISLVLASDLNPMGDPSFALVNESFGDMISPIDGFGL